jgi:hypothetical protein
MHLMCKMGGGGQGFTHITFQMHLSLLLLETSFALFARKHQMLAFTGRKS